MKAKSRVILEIVAPALIGSILLFVWEREFTRTFRWTPELIVIYLAFAYAIAIIPSLVYAFMMERWLRSRPLDSVRRLGAIVLSTLFGFGAACAIFGEPEAPETWIGALVGLLLGLVLGLSAKNEEKKA